MEVHVYALLKKIGKLNKFLRFSVLFGTIFRVRVLKRFMEYVGTLFQLFCI